MRLLGVDFGERRVGLALSDPDGRLAVPSDTLRRHSDRQLIDEIGVVAERERIEGIILGDPVGLDGHPGLASKRVRRFARRLERELALPVLLIEESLTSVEAEHRLRQAGVDPRQHPERIDALAAQILLQEALDRDLEPTITRAPAP